MIDTTVKMDLITMEFYNPFVKLPEDKEEVWIVLQSSDETTRGVPRIGLPSDICMFTLTTFHKFKSKTWDKWQFKDCRKRVSANYYPCDVVIWGRLKKK